jgi:hypothetical protein
VAEPITGSCLCASGAGGSVNAVVPSAAFRITRGTPKRYSARADSGRLLNRYFCGECGSPVYSQRDATPETVVVRAGLMDDAREMKIVSNIWTKSARPWAQQGLATYCTGRLM